MHTIEPHYNWLHIYDSSEDELSPFHGKEYNEFEFTETIYNYYIHPRWDYFGSPTLYLKILAVDYVNSFAIIELLGEWNDAIHNDVMFLKSHVIQPLLGNGIRKFILIGENVLNFHNSDDCYYEEWFDDIKDDDGWIAILNLREHVITEMNKVRLGNYVHYEGTLKDLVWRPYEPINLFYLVENQILKSLA